MSAPSEPRCYVVCDRCGYFYGDVYLGNPQGIECPECRSDAAWAFGRIDKALDYQAQVREANTRG